jgi:hypothetical protein
MLAKGCTTSMCRFLLIRVVGGGEKTFTSLNEVKISLNTPHNLLIKRVLSLFLSSMNAKKFPDEREQEEAIQLCSKRENVIFAVEIRKVPALACLTFVTPTLREVFEADKLIKFMISRRVEQFKALKEHTSQR